MVYTRRYCLATTLLLVLLNGCGGSGDVAQTMDQSPGDETSAVQQLLTPIDSATPYSNHFDDDRVLEVSGLQRSASLEGIYYAHNDSGHEAIVYATDASAMVLGVLRLSGVQANDWEAIAGVRLSGVPHIVVGDIGNNSGERNDLKLHVVEEPDFTGLTAGFDIEVGSRQINLSYADGRSYDAEALFIDGDNDTVVVLVKSGQDTANQSMWRGSLASGLTDGNMVLEFRGVVSLPDQSGVNAITDIDIHPDGRQLALLTYGLPPTGIVHIWKPVDSEGTADALTRASDATVSVPSLGANFQAEAISYSPDGSYILVAAESGANTNSTVTVISP